MHLDHLAGAGALVEEVDVLRHHRGHEPPPLEFRERPMPGVRLCLGQDAEPTRVEVPDLLGIAPEGPDRPGRSTELVGLHTGLVHPRHHRHVVPAKAIAQDLLRGADVDVGAAEFMDQKDTDMNAQLTKIKGTGGDTLFVTTAVEQITLILKQAQEQRLARKIVTTGGSSSPSQLIKQAGAAAEGSYHLLFFVPWFPEAMPDPKLAKAFVDEWNKRGHPFEGLTEGFRGHDGIATIAEAVKIAGKDDPKAVREALWKVQITGVNGPIKFEKDGAPGKESGQSKPSIFVVQIKGGKVALPEFMAKK